MLFVCLLLLLAYFGLHDVIIFLVEMFLRENVLHLAIL